MLAYDLDGIFQPDIIYDPKTFPEVHCLRSKWLYPFFQPSGIYTIITGRPVDDKVETCFWIEKFLHIQPVCVFHENVNHEKGWQYKVEVLKSNPELDVFIESDPEQADNIRRCVKQPVYVLSELIQKSLQEVSDAAGFAKYMHHASNSIRTS